MAFSDNIISFVLNWKSRDFIIFGDFNSVIHGEEQWGVNGFGSTSEELLNLVNALELHDLPLQGSPFTYFNSGQVAAYSRIDGFLVLDRDGLWFSSLT